MDEDKISVFLNPKTPGIHSGQEIAAAYLTTSSAKIISSMPLSSTERGLHSSRKWSEVLFFIFQVEEVF
jgi:hypothetical protein